MTRWWRDYDQECAVWTAAVDTDAKYVFAVWIGHCAYEIKQSWLESEQRWKFASAQTDVVDLNCAPLTEETFMRATRKLIEESE